MATRVPPWVLHGSLPPGLQLVSLGIMALLHRDWFPDQRGAGQEWDPTGAIALLGLPSEEDTRGARGGACYLALSFLHS
jgi:hypothetical protein